MAYLVIYQQYILFFVLYILLACPFLSGLAIFYKIAKKDLGGFSGFQGYLFYVVFLLIIYLFLIVVPFGMSDDYASLDYYQSHTQQDNLSFRLNAGLEAGIPAGRVLGYSLGNLLWHPQTIQDISTYRIIPLLLIGFFCLLLYKLQPYNQVESFLFPLCLVALPSFQIWLAWSGFFLVPLTLSLSLLASLVLHKTLHSSNRTWLFSGGLAVFIIWLSLNIYQPGAMYFWVITALLIMRGRVTSLKEKSRFFICGISGMGAYYFTTVLLFRLLTQPSTRAALSFDVISKLQWFFQTALLDSLNLYNLNIFPLSGINLGIILFTAGMIIGGGLLAIYKNKKWLDIILIGACIFLSYAPNLIIMENWSTYRSKMAVASLLLILFIEGFGKVMTSISTLIKIEGENIKIVIMSGLILVGAFLCVLNSTYLLALPGFFEQRYLSTRLSEINWSASTSLKLFPPGWSDSIAPFSVYDEFGHPNTFSEWGSISLSRILLREQGQDVNKIKIMLLDGENPQSLSSENEIDMRQMRYIKFLPDISGRNE
jgi:hypothetical protein